MKFQKGARVKLTAEWINSVRRIDQVATFRGTVLGTQRKHDEIVRVKWDHRTTPENYFEDFLEEVPA